MDNTYFKQKSLILARQIYPNLDGDSLIQEAERIFSYLNANEYQNFIGLNMIADDVVSFAEMLTIRDSVADRKLQLYDFQRDTLNHWQSGTDNIVVHARQMGISMLICIYALWLASFKSGINVCIVSPKAASAQLLTQQVIEFHKFCGFKLPALTKANRNQLQFANRNRIAFLNPSTYMIGTSFSHVLADNAASISYADDENFYSTIMLANSGQSIITGTPGNNVGVFYDMVSSKVLFQNQKTYLPFDHHPRYTKAWEDHMRAAIGNEAYEREYNCEFTEARV
ncbi:hypothetical protein D3C87_768420 [compost metagenome]